MEWINTDLNAQNNNAVGFIYMIEYLPTGQRYIGKKQLYKTRTKKEKYKNGNEKKVKVKSESDWQKYYSSNLFLKSKLKSDGPEAFNRIILQYCYSLKELTYREIEYQIKNNVLEDDNYLNDNISGKFFHKDLIKNNQ